MSKIEKQPSMADIICDLRIRKIKNQFFKQIDTLIDWKPITTLINRHYTKGMNAVGTPAYDGLLLFKMSLLQTWYGLSDYEVEERINDTISFSKFCDLTLEQSAPDHSTLSRFRTIMTKNNAYDKLLKAMNKQLEKHKIIVKTGVIVDASVIDTPLKPHTKPNYEIAEDRNEDARNEVDIEKEKEEKQILQIKQPGADTDAAWLKKGGKSRYGYKKHVITDTEGLILGVHTTAANVNEIANLEDVLQKVDIPENIYFYGDKGYKSAKNDALLKSKKLKNRVLHKAKKNKALTDAEKRFNKLCGKIRYKVERTFGSIKRWFLGGVARYRGICKMHTQNLMEAMAYNLYRCPAIIALNSNLLGK
jgi:IS5 family transposase